MRTTEDLQALARDVRPTSRPTSQLARQRLEDLAVAPGATGALQTLAVWWAGTRPAADAPPPRQVRVLVVAADHGIAGRGVSALPLGHTAVTLRGLREGRSISHAAAAEHGAEVRWLEVDVAGVDGPRCAPFDVGDAMDEALLGDALDQGAAAADQAAADGVELLVLGELNVGGSTTAAAVVGAAQRRRVLEVVGRGSGVDDGAWMRKAAAVREGLRRARTRPRDVPSLLRVVGAADVAAMTALLLRCAAQQVPVLLDGPVSAAAAVLAHRVSPSARQWWLFPERGEEQCSHRAQDALGMSPVHDLGVRTGMALPGLVALGTLRTAVAVATTAPTTAGLWPHGHARDVEEDPHAVPGDTGEDPHTPVDATGEAPEAPVGDTGQDPPAPAPEPSVPEDAPGEEPSVPHV